VVTASGLRVEGDAVVVGAGVAPDVMLATRAGLDIGERGGVLTDARLRTSAPGVYAAGDICEYDSVLHGGARLRIEHWDVAEQQGATVAGAMLGAEEPHAAVPYFFADLADWASLEYVGPASRWDEEIVRGAPEDGAFSILYLDGGRLAAALSVGRPDDLEAARGLLGSDVSARRAELADPDTPL
jgi:3-phenylpropionate/trans-cinnamate dioxygenase ferredoxin reductase subunit